MAAHQSAAKLSLAQRRFAEANALQAKGDEAGAARLFRRIIATSPNFAPAHNNLGVALYRTGDLKGAEIAWRAAVGLQPGYFDAAVNLATVLRARGALDEALAAMRQAGPGRVEGWNDLGAGMHGAGRMADALACFDTAVAADPTRPEAHSNRGVALGALGRRGEAIAAFRQAIALRPGHVEAWVNLGATHGAWDPEEAIACHRRAVALAPGNADAQHNLGLALLLTGNGAGWAGFDWWDRTAQGARERREIPVPAWDGKPLAGTLLLHCQQGFGDAIQFARFAALAAERAGPRGRVVLEAPAPLALLFQGLAGPAEVVVRGTAVPGVAAHAPLQRLPLLLGAWPLAGRVPYLSGDASLWAPRLAGLPGRRIGLVWGGNPALGRRAADAVDARRSIGLAALAPLAGVPGASFVSLQKGDAAAQAADAAFPLHDWTDELRDFAATADLIAALDLVITVDTSVAHLAGAMGKPVWLLNRFDTDWRWGVGRADSAWYPTLRQFRQDRPGDWASVVDCLVDALRTDADAAALAEAGQAAWQAGERRTAAGLFRRAVTLHPGQADAQCNLGLALQAEGNHPGAEAAFRAAIAAAPRHVPALVNLARRLRARGAAEEAEACLRAALAADPAQPVALGNLANLLAGSGRGEEALGLHARALATAPDEVELRINQGITLAGLQRPGPAIDALRAAIARAPDHAGAHVALAEALLLDGQYREGFREYAWRWKLPSAAPRTRDRPEWDGRQVGEQSVLIQSEQGMGDAIMFARFATQVAKRARVVLQVPAPLVRLLSGIEGVTAVVPREAPAPATNLRADLMDLPGLLGIRLATLAAPRSYLSAEPGRFAARLGRLPGRKVGLAWAGNPALRALGGADLDARRSLSLAQLAPLAAVQGVTFVSLQVGAAGREAAPFPLHDWTGEFADFADTAALIAGLDLVIAVDTAVAHLAAAMGKPVWLLNRFDCDWRWGVGRVESAWYPTLLQFRQPRWGDWARVVEAVAALLAKPLPA